MTKKTKQTKTKIDLLATSKLNSIEKTMCETLIDSSISHEEFALVVIEEQI